MNNRINRFLAHGTGIIINVYTYRIIYNWEKKNSNEAAEEEEGE
jgi:hypothetical protein